MTHAASERTEFAGRWRIVGTLLVAAVLSLLDRLILSLLVAPIQADLHVTDIQIGLLQGLAFALPFALGCLPFGWLADRAPRGAIAAAGILIWSLMTIACGYATSYQQLFIARMGVGLGEAALAPVSQSLIADMFKPRELPLAMSVYGLGATLGAAIAFAAGGAVVAAASSGAPVALPGLAEPAVWRTVFVLIGALGLIVAPLVLTIVKEPPQLRTTTAALALVEFARQRGLLLALLVAGLALIAASGFAIAGWMPTFLARRFGWDAGAAGLVLGVSVLLSAPGGIACGWLAARWIARGRKDGALRLIILAHGLTAPFLFLAFMAATPTQFFLLIFPALPLGAAYVGLGASVIQSIAPASLRGRIAGVYVLVINLVGMTSGPFGVALLTDMFFADPDALGRAITIAAPAFLLAGVTLLAMARRSYLVAIDSVKATAETAR